MECGYDQYRPSLCTHIHCKCPLYFDFQGNVLLSHVTLRLTVDVLSASPSYINLVSAITLTQIWSHLGRGKINEELSSTKWLAQCLGC